MSTTTFTPQVIGETEKALNAILERELAGPGLTEHQWITLVLTVSGGESVPRDRLAARLGRGIRIGDAAANTRIDELIAAQLLQAGDGEGSPISLTDNGRAVFSRIRAAVTDITERLWGDLPAEDLQVAARVLDEVRTRADAELAAA